MANSIEGGDLKSQAGLNTERDIPEGRGGGMRGMVVGEIHFNGIKPKRGGRWAIPHQQLNTLDEPRRRLRRCFRVLSSVSGG